MQLLVVSCNCKEGVISSEQARGYSHEKSAVVVSPYPLSAWCFGNERRPTTANCFASLYQNYLNAGEHLLGHSLGRLQRDYARGCSVSKVIADGAPGYQKNILPLSTRPKNRTNVGVSIHVSAVLPRRPCMALHRRALPVHLPPTTRIASSPRRDDLGVANLM